MKIKFLIALCSVVSICVEVYAVGEQEVKRGVFPYMAFLYYPDKSVVDGTGSRFLRGAILIRSDWLVTSAVGPSIVPGAPNGFPRKTLLARLGAVAIDNSFTLNEDEDEQEREVIQIVRPYNHSATQWWRTDISLMKVLLPFNITSAVDTGTLNFKTSIPERTCIILVYANWPPDGRWDGIYWKREMEKKKANTTEDRSLMQLRVEMLPPGNQNCGPHYTGNTMTCASDSDENKNAVYDPNFCQGNSGGPLICENDIVGLQTYIDNDCKQPHLYQLLSPWVNLITCGTEDKCQEVQCLNICDVINKDTPTTLVPTKTSEEFSETTKTSSETKEAFSEDTEASSEATSEATDASSEATEPSSEATEPSSEATEPSSEATEPSSEKSKATPSTAEPSNEPQTTPTTSPDTITDENEMTSEVSTVNVSFITNTPTVSGEETVETQPWSNEKDSNARKNVEEEEVDSNGRNPAMQAQRHKPVSYSTDSSNTSHLSMCLSIFYGFLIILACLI